MSFLTGVILLAVVTAVACALPGVFVVLRRGSMLVDAISHAVFPGIVLGFALTRDLDSPLLLLGAAVTGLLVVLGAEFLERTGLIAGDAPQGLVFPALFSLGVIAVTLDFGDVHLDTHTVLVGDLNIAAFEQLVVGGIAIGPSYLHVMLGMLALNALFLTAFWRPLVASTFDRPFATSIGIRTRLLHLSFMLLVALTVTAGFHAAGAILVIALVVVPAAVALLLSRRLVVVIALAVGIAAGGALMGFGAAYALDAATSAGMAVTYGILFFVVLGVTALRRRRRVAWNG